MIAMRMIIVILMCFVMWKLRKRPHSLSAQSTGQSPLSQVLFSARLPHSKPVEIGGNTTGQLFLSSRQAAETSRSLFCTRKTQETEKERSKSFLFLTEDRTPIAGRHLRWYKRHNIFWNSSSETWKTWRIMMACFTNQFWMERESSRIRLDGPAPLGEADAAGDVTEIPKAPILRHFTKFTKTSKNKLKILTQNKLMKQRWTSWWTSYSKPLIVNLMKDIRHHETRQYLWQFIIQNLTISVVNWPRGIHNAIHRTAVLPATRLFNVGPWQRRGQFHRKPVRAARQDSPLRPVGFEVLARPVRRSCRLPPIGPQIMRNVSWSLNWKLPHATLWEQDGNAAEALSSVRFWNRRLQAFPQKTHGLLVTKCW